MGVRKLQYVVGGRDGVEESLSRRRGGGGRWHMVMEEMMSVVGDKITCEQKQLPR